VDPGSQSEFSGYGMVPQRESISSLSRHTFWPDDVSYLDMPVRGLTGHRQVTGAYLVLLARKHGGVLATMDQALAAVHEGTILIG
jgi:hypothetical protein